MRRPFGGNEIGGLLLSTLAASFLIPGVAFLIAGANGDATIPRVEPPETPEERDAEQQRRRMGGGLHEGRVLGAGNGLLALEGGFPSSRAVALVGVASAVDLGLDIVASYGQDVTVTLWSSEVLREYIASNRAGPAPVAQWGGGPHAIARARLADGRAVSALAQLTLGAAGSPTVGPGHGFAPEASLSFELGMHVSRRDSLELSPEISVYADGVQVCLGFLAHLGYERRLGAHVVLGARAVLGAAVMMPLPGFGPNEPVFGGSGTIGYRF